MATEPAWSDFYIYPTEGLMKPLALGGSPPDWWHAPNPYRRCGRPMKCPSTSKRSVFIRCWSRNTAPWPIPMPRSTMPCFGRTSLEFWNVASLTLGLQYDCHIFWAKRLGVTAITHGNPPKMGYHQLNTGDSLTEPLPIAHFIVSYGPLLFTTWWGSLDLMKYLPWMGLDLKIYERKIFQKFSQ